jgi:hypothetical protein
MLTTGFPVSGEELDLSLGPGKERGVERVVCRHLIYDSNAKKSSLKQGRLGKH